MALCPDGSAPHVNLFGHDQYNGQCDFFGGQPALPQGLGWFIVVGLGAAFSIFTSLTIWLDRKYSGAKSHGDDWAGAGRSINIGLTACDIVSKWTWAATLLQSSNVAYKYGVSGPFWYASGATIQVLLFAILAVEIKRKAPQINTVLQIIKCRWGTMAHMVFLTFCLLTNTIVTSMLILGGAAVTNALTGVDLYAAAFLIPIGVCFYTAHGGLRACYLASWSHVAIIYIALCTFTLTIYGTSSDLGSPSAVYHNLRQMEEKVPVTGNLEGSYLTMLSRPGLIFGIINIIGNFGTVFVDQAYWQSAIAARPSATYKGYLLGGLCWFAIPFTMATSLGLAGRALDLPITIDESNSGLVPPAVALHLLGKGGAFLLTFQLFMAVTASASAEQMAVSTLITYDVYVPYINPKATPKQILWLGRAMVGVWAVLSGVLAVILFKIGLNLGWVYEFMGVVIGSAVFPIAAAITWKKCTKWAAVLGAGISMPLALMTWLVTTATLNSNEVNLTTTFQDYPMLAGNLVALMLSVIITCVVTWISPEDYDWSQLKQINNQEVTVEALLTQDSAEMLNKVLSWTYKTGGVLSLLLIVLWPLLALPAKVFSQGYFTFWVILAIVWGLLAAVGCVLLPLWQAKDTFINAFKHIFLCQPPPEPETMGAMASPGSADPSVDIKIQLAAHEEQKMQK